MNVGTKSVLFGAHCFFIHPWFVALAWWKLWGFHRVTCPSSKVTTSLLDWRLWLAFAVHDLGYWGSPNMDGEEGEKHPEWAANFVANVADAPGFVRWFFFVLYHSRFYARRDSGAPSLLCYADKLAVALEPWWLYLPRVVLTGEVREYMALAGRGKYADGKHAGEMRQSLGSVRSWHRAMTRFCRAWAMEHYQEGGDTWTPPLELQEKGRTDG